MKKQEEILADPVEKLKLLLEQGEFELLEEKTEGRISYRLIYLMNDAVESFLVLKNCRMTGEYLADYEGKIETELREYKEENVKSETGFGNHSEKNKYILVVHQGDSVCTLMFTGLEEEVHLYNYGTIGHFWVKRYEYLRQLEYTFAIIRDKREYLGERYCNRREQKLAALADFPPLNYTCYPAVPAKYIVLMEDPWNPTEEAMDVMEELVKEAGDKSLLWWLQRYRRYHGKRMSRWIARLLHREKHAAVVDLLNKKLAKEAENYPRRDFGEKFNQKYQNILKKAEKRKAELESNGQKVTLVREEPFAVARDSVDFKVYLMIWKEKQGDRVVEIEEF